MLQAQRKLCGYRILENKKELAAAKFNSFRAGGNLTVQKQSYKVVVKGMPLLSRYELRQGKACVAVITTKWLPLPPTDILTYGDQEYQIRNQTLTQNGQVLGLSRIHPKTRWFWSAIELDIPQHLPLIPKLFLAWKLLSLAGGD